MATELSCANRQSETGSQLLKVLRISHSGSVAAYRERERQLISNFPVQLKLIIPDRWQHLGGDNGAVVESFEVAKAKTYGTGNIPLFAYDLPTIARHLKEFQPDLVDIHEEPYSVSCFEIVSLAKYLLPKASCVFYSAQNILKRYPFPFSSMEQFVYRNCDGAYPCSGGVQEVLKAKGFDTNSSIIPLGVDPDFFQVKKIDRSLHGLKAGSVVIGYFGRLEECKGIEVIFDAVRQLPSQVNAQILMVGSGTHENALRKLAGKFGLQERVVWAGALAMEDVPVHLNLCDLVVVPSITTATWKEQFGRVVVEAMACGVPVIASDSGSLSEVVGEAGVIVPEQDAASLSEKITLLATDSALWHQLRERGLQTVQQQYTWKKVAELTFEFYQRALERAALRACKNAFSKNL